MKRFFGIGLCLVVAVAFVSCKKKEPKTSCLYGDNIPEAELNAILGATDQMINLLEEGKLKEIYEMGTEEMKSLQTRDQFSFTLELFLKAFGNIEYPKLQEAYYMTSEAKQDQVMIACNLGEPGIDDLYSMPANRDLAVVIYRVQTELELVRVIFQLERQEGVWKLRSLTLAPATIKNRLYEYYFNQAQRFREQNLLHLASLYYKTAILISDVGLNCEEFAVRAIEAQLDQIKTDYMPGGDIQVWAMPSGQSYKVYNLDAAYDNGKLLVHVSYMNPSLSDHAQLEKQAREIASFLDQKFPEYRLGFDGIRVTAASEKKEEQLMAYHSVVLFKELPPPPNIPTLKPEPPQITPGPGPESTAGATPSLAPGATAFPSKPIPAESPLPTTPPAPAEKPAEEKPKP